MPPTQNNSANVPPGKKIAKIFLVIYGVVAALLSIPAAYIAFFISVMANDSPHAPFWALLLPVILPLIPLAIPGGLFVIGYILFKKQKYSQASIFLACVLVCMVTLGGYVTWKTGIIESIKIASAPERTSPAPGFLIPSPTSIPKNFTEQSHSYKVTRYSGYGIWYTAPTVWHWANLSIAEGGDDPAYGYDQEVGRVDSTMTKSDFSYNGAPGVIFSGPSRKHAGLVKYELHWNDQGRDVGITLDGVPPDAFSSDSVLAILKSLIRS